MARRRQRFCKTFFAATQLITAGVQVREALVDLNPTAAAVAQSRVTCLLVPVADLVALAPRPLINQLLHDAAAMSALLAHPSQRTPAQQSLIAEKVKDTAALGTLPELQRRQVAAASQFMRVPSGSCVFYKVLMRSACRRAMPLTMCVRAMRARACFWFCRASAASASKWTGTGRFFNLQPPQPKFNLVSGPHRNFRQLPTAR